MRDLRVSVDLLEFFRTGRFDCLRLGQSQEWILHNFPDPDDWTNEMSMFAARTIWRYGNVELHFEAHTLRLIFSDYVNTLDGGPSIALERWRLGDPTYRTLRAMMEALTTEKIDFTKTTNRIGQIELQLTSGVVLTFDDLDRGALRELNANELGLIAFELRG